MPGNLGRWARERRLSRPSSPCSWSPTLPLHPVPRTGTLAGQAEPRWRFYSAVTTLLLSSKPTPGPTNTPREGQTLLEKWFPTPLQRDRCRGKKGPLDLWKLYKVYRVLASQKEKKPVGWGWVLGNGEGPERASGLCVQTPDEIPRGHAVGGGGQPFCNNCWGRPAGRPHLVFRASW